MESMILRAIEAAVNGDNWSADRLRLIAALEAAKVALGHAQFELRRRNDAQARDWSDKAEAEFLRVWLSE